MSSRGRRQQDEADGREQEPDSHRAADAEARDELRRLWRHDHHGDGVGQHAEPGLERAVALHELQVLRQQEEHPEHREEGERDGRRAAAEAREPEQARVEHRVRSAAAPSARTPSSEDDGDDEGADRDGRRPSRARAPRSPPNTSDTSADDGEDGADGVERVAVAGPSTSARCAPTAASSSATSGTLMKKTEPHQKCSSRRPDEIGPERAADAGERGPHRDRLRPLVEREAVHDDRQRRRHDEGGADAHRRASGDELAGVVRCAGDEAGEAEHDEPELQRALAAEAVAEGAGRQEHARRTRGRRRRRSTAAPCRDAPSSSWMRRQGDVQRADRHHDHHEADAQRAEDPATAGGRRRGRCRRCPRVRRRRRPGPLQPCSGRYTRVAETSRPRASRVPG